MVHVSHVSAYVQQLWSDSEHDIPGDCLGVQVIVAVSTLLEGRAGHCIILVVPEQYGACSPCRQQ